MNVKEILEKYPTSLPVQEASKLMNKPAMFLYCGLRANKFPFGTGVKMEREFSYYINTKNFLKYIGEEVE